MWSKMLFPALSGESHEYHLKWDYNRVGKQVEDRGASEHLSIPPQAPNSSARSG